MDPGQRFSFRMLRFRPFWQYSSPWLTWPTHRGSLRRQRLAQSFHRAPGQVQLPGRTQHSQQQLMQGRPDSRFGPVPQPSPGQDHRLTRSATTGSPSAPCDAGPGRWPWTPATNQLSGGRSRPQARHAARRPKTKIYCHHQPSNSSRRSSFPGYENDAVNSAIMATAGLRSVEHAMPRIGMRSPRSAIRQNRTSLPPSRMRTSHAPGDITSRSALRT
jgi:hypothetical protein